MRTGNWVRGGLIAGVLTLGCGSEDWASPEDLAEGGEELLLCEEHTLEAPDGTLYLEHERYVLPAINRKLRSYPDLAASIGLERVSTCEDARAFMAGFQEYAATHVGFDDSEIYEPGTDFDPGPYPGGEPEIELPKLLNSTAAFNYPIVRLNTNRNAVCTGIFIAKNWILTAAHCLAYQDPKAPKTKTQPFEGYYPYRLDRGKSDGKIYMPVGITGTFLQYPHPSWFGWQPGQGTLGPVNDVALLYLHAETYDKHLPPDPSNSAMRITARAPTENATYTVWGWGPSTWDKATDTTGIPDTLRRGNIVPAINLQTLRYTVPSNSAVRPCIADSGGPATRSATVAGASQSIVVGLVGGNVTDFSEKCAESQDVVGFPRIDHSQVRAFINNTMKKWNGKDFKCTEYTAGSTAVDYARCWGDVCSSNAQCKSTHTCKGLIPEKPEVKGQCLPKPK